MSAGKSYNRIVFVTTLSLYLGLVLVSGASPALAHSALNKHFDVRNEIEYKDDFDNKPDNEEIETVPDNVPILFAQLLNEIKGNINDGKIAFPISQDFNLAIERGEYRDGSGHGTGAFCGDGNLFYLTVENALRDGFQRQGWKLSEYVDAYRNTKTSLEAVAGNWTLKVSFSKANAAEFAEFLNREFASSANSIEDKPLKQIYKNTNASFENNQVFIVTRLPRAAIDSLLK